MDGLLWWAGVAVGLAAVIVLVWGAVDLVRGRRAEQAERARAAAVLRDIEDARRHGRGDEPW